MYTDRQTTYEQTFAAPQFMPGYAGHCPEVKYGYGETFGSATTNFFHDYRQRRLAGWRGGDFHTLPFPSVYSNPAWLAGTRDRSRARWLPPPAYELTNVGPRHKEVMGFDKLCQEHREHYRDRSETCQPVSHFILSQPLEQMQSLNERSMHGLSALPINRSPEWTNGSRQQRELTFSSRVQSARPQSTRSARPMSTRRDRAMRDSVFENRAGNNYLPQ